MKKKVILFLVLVVASLIFIGCQSKVETKKGLEPISLEQIELTEPKKVLRGINPLEEPIKKPTEIKVEVEELVEKEEPQLTIDEVVDKIMRGDLGDGAARIKAIEELGHDPVEVQEIVNERISASTLALVQNLDPAPIQNPNLEPVQNSDPVQGPNPEPVQNSAPVQVQVPAQGNVIDIFHEICAEKGLSQTEIDGWAFIITKESNWSIFATNPTSGAYGLPQSLPGNKMATHGADWQTNPYTQLYWMYDYMVNRYGSIQGAVDFWNANYWY